MQNEVRNAIIENRLLSRGDRCIIAVSGGADSMGLLHVLIRLNGILKVSFRVVHVHHGLRGKEADRDADFVKSVCGRYGINCRIIQVKVREFAEEHRLSTEEAGRYLRYQALEKEALNWEREEDTQKQVKIAVAHNKEDNAETILMQLARGSGLKGISGMSRVRGRIIRPLLDISRRDIEKYLIKEEESWINDSTNAESEYTRNRIRHDILPVIVKEVNTGAVENITRAGKMVGQADRYIARQAERLLEGNVEAYGNGYRVPAAIFEDQDDIIKTYMIRNIIGRLNKSMKNITAKHIEETAALINAETGKRTELPYRIEAEKEYGYLRIYRRRLPGASGDKEDSAVSGKFTFRTFPYTGEKAPEDKFVKWFDYGKTGSAVETRFRRPGDVIELRGVGKKSLRTFMTDAKIPLEKRDEIYLVAAGSDIIWIVGCRISEKYKVSKATETVLEIRYEEGEN